MKEVEEFVKEKFRESDIRYVGVEWFFKYHISVVHRLGMRLAEKYGADKTVVGLATLLHDIGLQIDSERHDEAGAEESKKVLERFGYPEDVREKVAECIRAHMHRYEPKSLEARIVCTTDALAKFKTPFFFVKFAVRKAKPEETIEWLQYKVDLEYEKIFFEDERKEVKEIYESLKRMLSGKI